MLFRLLTLFALFFAPLAAPVAATTMVQRAAVACNDKTMHSAGHEMPAGEHQRGAPCCTAVPAAIDPPLPLLGVIEPIAHRPFAALAEPFALGAGPKADYPPPRIS